MQVTPADKNKTPRVSAAEDCINFRPSPNFKNMKKFLKSRTELEKTSTAKNVVPEEKIAKKEEIKEDVKVKPLQPPLPPYPPPPDSPSLLAMHIKQEKIDLEEDFLNAEFHYEPVPSAGMFKQETITSDTTTTSHHSHTASQAQQESPRPKRPMCKEFIRGNCKRPVCKFAHEIDLEQLPGVFTFCWNYQNDVCKYPNCRYVHATQFEEADFYRTGVLPPHARSHQLKAPPPLPPGAPPPQPQPSTSAFRNPPPATNLGTPPATASFVQPGFSARSLEDEVNALFALSTSSSSPSKRDWRDMAFASTSRDPGSVTKKCKNCDMMEFRVQYNKEKVEGMLQSSEDLNRRMSLLDKKSARLTNVLLTLLKPQATPNPAFNIAGPSSIADIDFRGMPSTSSGTGNMNLSSLMGMLFNRDQAGGSRDT